MIEVLEHFCCDGSGCGCEAIARCEAAVEMRSGYDVIAKRLRCDSEAATM
uniref:Uncharacterized protein n=1 Tax=viral metagenome TaxID=1070528 RepID=A0A6C0CCH6_9ZZZZ